MENQVYQDNSHLKQSNKQDLKIALRLVMTAVFLLGALVHTVYWDTHAIEVVPLQLKKWTGMASAQDYDRLAEICKEQAKTQCLVDSRLAIYKKWPQNLEAIAKLGHAYALHKDFHNSQRAFKVYFDKEGGDVDMAYEYAKVLGEVGNIDESSEVFEAILKTKPDTLQITVLRTYISMLTQNNQLETAKKVIERTQKLGVNARYFMSSELDQIKEQLKSRG